MAAAGPLMAQAPSDFPSRPLRIIVPFPPGGSADATARVIGQKLAEQLKQPVVIENRPGANGLIGMDAVAKAAPDGYTLLMSDRGAFGVNPALFKKLPYDPLHDYAYVGLAAWAPYVLIANKNVAANNLPELVKLAQRSSCKLNYASFGIGSMPQLGIESLDKHYKICMTHVPYKGGGPAIAATMAGEVDVTLATIGPALPYVKDGRVKAIVVGSDKRSPLLPDTRTVTEDGGTADLIPRTWFGFALPAHTPQPIVQRLAKDVSAVVGSREVTAYLLSNGLEPAGTGPEEMARVVKKDIASFSQLIKQIGIQPE